MVGTLENELVKRQDRQLVTEDLDEYDRKIIGTAVRLEIPFTSVYNMRRVAQVLIGYAEMLNNYSHRHDIKDRAILFHLKMEARRANRKIREICHYRLRPSEEPLDAKGRPLPRN
jgi:hypothetical protein